MSGHRVEYPVLSTRYLLPPRPADRPGPGVADAYTTLATRLDASTDGVSINGQPVPWYLADVPIQLDEQSGMPTVAYLPVLIDGPVVAGPGVRDTTLGEMLANEPPAHDPFPGPSGHQDGSGGAGGGRATGGEPPSGSGAR